MRRIYKYKVTEEPIEFRGKILHVGRQDGQIYIWAIHDDSLSADRRKIHVVGTGQLLSDSMQLSNFCNAPYIGTIQDQSSPFVWHLFAEMVGWTDGAVDLRVV